MKFSNRRLITYCAANTDPMDIACHRCTNDNARWERFLGPRHMPRVSRSMESLWFLEYHLPVEGGAMKTGNPPLLFTLARFHFFLPQGSIRLHCLWIPFFTFNETRFCTHTAIASILLGYHHMTRLKVPSIYILTFGSSMFQHDSSAYYNALLHQIIHSPFLTVLWP